MEKIRKFFKDEAGANMVEYALLLALISVVAIAILQTLGSNVQTTFQSASDAIQRANQ